MLQYYRPNIPSEQNCKLVVDFAGKERWPQVHIYIDLRSVANGIARWSRSGRKGFRTLITQESGERVGEQASPNGQ